MKQPDETYEKTIPKTPCIFCEEPTPIEKWEPPRSSGGVRANEGCYRSIQIGNKVICDECLSKLYSLLKYRNY